MTITRTHFGDERAAAMDEIAILVLGVKTLRDSGEAFENLEDLNDDRTFDKAKPVLQFLENTATQLLAAICQGKTKRARQLAAIRKKGAIQLGKLMPAIEDLARLQITMFADKDAGGANIGTSVRDYVLNPLVSMRANWTAASNS